MICLPEMHNGSVISTEMTLLLCNGNTNTGGEPMHEYYRKNKGKLQKEMDGYLKLVRSEIEAVFGKSYPQAFAEIWSCYEREMLEHFPFIGGDSSSGTRNLTGCMFFVAVGVVGKKYGLSTNDWGRLVTTLYERYFDQMPRLLRRLAGGLFHHCPGLVAKALKKKDKRNAENAAKNPGSFLTQTMEPTEEYSMIYHNLVCPIYEFCKERGYMEYLPYMCNLDYVMFRAFGVSLYREKTCAAGDGVCDFKIKRSAPIPSVWPPHILDASDPLK